MTLTYSATLPATPSGQVQAALKWAEGGSAFDVNIVGPVIVDDYSHAMIPENANLPKFNSKTEFLARIGAMGGVFARFNMDIKDLIEAPGAVILHLDLKSETKTGINGDVEVIVTLYTVAQPDGTYKIKRAREFIDTVRFAKFAEAMRKAAA